MTKLTPKIHIAPEQEHVITISDDELIKSYNAILQFETENQVILDAKQSMKDQLINRDIITNDHEGEVVI